MSKRLIGYGYTNANGVATLDYDAEGNELSSSGYVGTGAGEVDISASAVIDGSTFVSETYEITDCTFYDEGTSSDTHNPNWNTNSDSVTLSYDNGYTLITPKTSDSNNRLIVPNASLPSVPFAVEFNKHTTTNNNDYMFIGTSIGLASRDMTNASHILFKVINSTTIEVYVDGTQKTNVTYSGSISNVRFQINSGGNNIGFSNFKVYPI